MTTLRLRLEGEKGAIKFDSLVGAMNRALLMLRDVDSVISARRRGSLDWIVEDLTMNSPSPVAVLRSVPRFEGVDERTAERVSAGFVSALETAETGEALPAYLSDIGLTHLEYLAGGLRKNGATRFEATFVEQNHQAEVGPEAAEHVRRLRVPKSKAIGSIIGTLEVVSLHRRYEYNVYDSVTKRAVRCTFDPERLEDVKRALGCRVSVAGIIHRNAKGQPLKIDQARLTVLPTEDELPTTVDFIGVDPYFTGDLSTDEYVRRLRDA